MYPVYVRGEAYLKAGKGQQAAAEFQKLIDHRGIVLNLPLAALTRLGLAPAYTSQGDTAKSRTRTRTSPPSGKTPTTTSSS